MSTTLCLTMIVKNESKVILRALESVYSYLDYWCIHDTGSTDQTPQIIQDFFDQKMIPGELHHTSWRDFGYNRSKVVESSRNKADYLILMDADFVFCIKDPNFKSQLSADGYNIRYEGAIDYRQNLLVKSGLDWHYVGVTHEYIHSSQARQPMQNFDGFTFNHLFDGGSRQDKFERDVRLLEQGIKDEPTNGRYYFYLAQSYFDLSRYQEALPCYQKRVDIGGWSEEVYYAMYRIGACQLKLNQSFDIFASSLLRAYFFRPMRKEALYLLVKHCRLHKERAMKERGFCLGMMAVNTPYPSDLLFIEKTVHTYLFLDEVAMCAYYSGHELEACQLGHKILKEAQFPTHEKKRLNDNYDWYKKGYNKHFNADYSDSDEISQEILPKNLPVLQSIKIQNMKTDMTTNIIVNKKDMDYFEMSELDVKMGMI